jgi:hypothetical protein
MVRCPTGGLPPRSRGTCSRHAPTGCCGAATGSAPVPDEGDLVDWLAEVVADQDGLNQVMVRNPARLYGFDVP